MANRLKNILKGMGSVLEICPASDYSFSNDKTDAEKLNGDWQKIGLDFQKSFHSVVHGQKDKKSGK